MIIRKNKIKNYKYKFIFVEVSIFKFKVVFLFLNSMAKPFFFSVYLGEENNQNFKRHVHRIQYSACKKSN